MVPHRLEDVEESDEVTLNVGTGILDRVAHPSLGGEVHDDVEAALCHEPFHERRVGDVAADEPKGPGRPVRCRLHHLYAVLLDAGVIVSVDVVDPGNVPSLANEASGQEGADEPSGAGD